MPRPRIYPTAADRQRAYRSRLAAGRSHGASSAITPRRQPSRPARLAALQEALRALTDEYQTWLDSLPESLVDSVQVERLKETIEQLEAAAERLEEVDPPRGFGRD